MVSFSQKEVSLFWISVASMPTLIASRIRQFGYKAEIRDTDTPAHLMANAAGIILSGVRRRVRENSPQADKGDFRFRYTHSRYLLFGHQWLAHAGGKVTSGHTKEIRSHAAGVSKRDHFSRDCQPN